jgi:hypothetical protein
MHRLSATVLPITTGSGRQYLLYLMGRGLKTGVLNDFWSFQIPSEEYTAYSVKDTIRNAVGRRANKSWGSGKFSWARCEIETKTGGDKGEGKGDKDKKGEAYNEKSSAAWPEGEGLYSFASDVWTDQGGNVFMIWGGKRAEEASAIDGGGRYYRMNARRALVRSDVSSEESAKAAVEALGKSTFASDRGENGRGP